MVLELKTFAFSCHVQGGTQATERQKLSRNLASSTPFLRVYLKMQEA
jgi:hypothetical protein